MLTDFYYQIALFTAGFFANVLASMSGGGAGLVQLPVLIFLGLPFSLALGTHKVAVVALGLGSLVKNHKFQDLNTQISIILLFVGVPSNILGTLLVLQVSEVTATLSLGIITILSVIYSAYKRDFGIKSTPHSLSLKEWIIGSILISLIAMLSGSFSSGAGLIAIMVLVMFFKLDIKTAITHSMIFVALTWNFTSALTIGLNNQIEWNSVPALVLGAFIGGFTGASILKKVNNLFIKKLFMLTMFVSGILLIYQAFSKMN